MLWAVPAESPVVRIEFARRVQLPAESTPRGSRSNRLMTSAIFSEPKVVLRHLSCLVRNRRHGAGNVPEIANSFNPSSRLPCSLSLKRGERATMTAQLPAFLCDFVLLAVRMPLAA